MKEFMTKSGLATVIALVTKLLGGWDAALEILVIFVVLDYLTGVAAAFKAKTLSSELGYKGIIKKATIFFVIIVAAQLDRITGNASNVFRTATTFFFVANEGLSILENAGEVGLPLPSFIMDVLKNLRDKSTKIDKGDLGDGT